MYELNQLLREKKALQRKLDEHLRSCSRRSEPGAIQSSSDMLKFSAYNIASVVQQPCATNPAAEQTVVKLEKAGSLLGSPDPSMQTITIVFSNNPLATSSDDAMEVPTSQYLPGSQDYARFCSALDASNHSGMSDDVQLYSRSCSAAESCMEAVDASMQHLPLAVSTMNDESAGGLS